MELIESLKQYQTLIASAIAALIAISYYIMKINHDRNVFKYQLFNDLNEKYNKLNNKLVDLVHNEFDWDVEAGRGQDRSLKEIWEILFEEEPTRMPEYISDIYDYVNLCSEEYYWYKKNYIDEDVWNCWHKGMKFWYESSYFFQRVVKREKKLNASYYNDDFLSVFE